MTRKAGRPPLLARWQIAYLKRAKRLRKELTDEALGRRFHISPRTVHDYMHGKQLHGCREDFDATVQKFRRMRTGVQA
jgi:hypothetical protein